MKALILAVLLVLAGCANTAQRQYEAAHQEFIEAKQRVTRLEEQLLETRKAQDVVITKAVEEALVSARAAYQEAREIREETHRDAMQESASNHAVWVTIWATLGIGLKALAGFVGAGKEALT